MRSSDGEASGIGFFAVLVVVFRLRGKADPTAIAAEVPIGSGLIESGHKHILQARLKLPRSCWLLPIAESMAQLRVLRANDRWSELRPLAA